MTVKFILSRRNVREEQADKREHRHLWQPS